MQPPVPAGLKQNKNKKQADKHPSIRLWDTKHQQRCVQISAAATDGSTPLPSPHVGSFRDPYEAFACPDSPCTGKAEALDLITQTAAPLLTGQSVLRLRDTKPITAIH